MRSTTTVNIPSLPRTPGIRTRRSHERMSTSLIRLPTLLRFTLQLRAAIAIPRCAYRCDRSFAPVLAMLLGWLLFWSTSCISDRMVLIARTTLLSICLDLFTSLRSLLNLVPSNFLSGNTRRIAIRIDWRIIWRC